MINNLYLYERVASVPDTAKKIITGGKLNGFTDINPMWRIRELTDQFGLCGVGWYYEITDQRIEASGDEVAAFVDINLYIKVNGDWSKPIAGVGGSKFVALEKGKLVMSDECFKMALTDAISVACKALGFGADVYWANGRSKYSQKKNAEPTPTQNVVPSEPITDDQKKKIKALMKLYAAKTNSATATVNEAVEAQFGKTVNEMTAAEAVSVYKFLGDRINEINEKENGH